MRAVNRQPWFPRERLVETVLYAQTSLKMLVMPSGTARMTWELTPNIVEHHANLDFFTDPPDLRLIKTHTKQIFLNVSLQKYESALFYLQTDSGKSKSDID